MAPTPSTPVGKGPCVLDGQGQWIAHRFRGQQGRPNQRWICLATRGVRDTRTHCELVTTELARTGCSPLATRLMADRTWLGVCHKCHLPRWHPWLRQRRTIEGDLNRFDPWILHVINLEALVNWQSHLRMKHFSGTFSCWFQLCSLVKMSGSNKKRPKIYPQ